MDATPPPVVAEIQAIKEQMEIMMNALKGRMSNDLDDLVNRTDSVHCLCQLLPPVAQVPHATYR